MREDFHDYMNDDSRRSKLPENAVLDFRDCYTCGEDTEQVATDDGWQCLECGSNPDIEP